MFILFIIQNYSSWERRHQKHDWNMKRGLEQRVKKDGSGVMTEEGQVHRPILHNTWEWQESEGIHDHKVATTFLKGNTSTNAIKIVVNALLQILSYKSKYFSREASKTSYFTASTNVPIWIMVSKPILQCKFAFLESNEIVSFMNNLMTALHSSTAQFATIKGKH